MKTPFQTKAGFTLIETLVAISIFVTSVTALLVVTGNGLHDTNTAQNRLTATYLAQEGVELTRAVRDNYFIAGGASATMSGLITESLASCDYHKDDSPNGCNIILLLQSTPVIDSCEYQYPKDENGNPISRTALESDSGCNMEPLFKNFTRVIYANEDSSHPNGLKVSVFVYWFEGTSLKSVRVDDFLTGWQVQ